MEFVKRLFQSLKKFRVNFLVMSRFSTETNKSKVTRKDRRQTKAFKQGPNANTPSMLPTFRISLPSLYFSFFLSLPLCSSSQSLPVCLFSLFSLSLLPLALPFPVCLSVSFHFYVSVEIIKRSNFHTFVL